MVAAEEGQERRLRPGRPLEPARRKLVEQPVQVAEIDQQVLQPEAGALADGGRLGGLKVRVGEAGRRAPALRERGERRDRFRERELDEAERLAHEDRIGVVGHVAGGRAEMDDPSRAGSDVAVAMDVGHHIVAKACLVARRGLEVDRLEPRPQLGELGVRDGEPEGLLGFGEMDPKPPPREDASPRREVGAHRGTRVARGEGVLVRVVLVAVPTGAE